MILGINHITIAVTDLDRSFNFYKNILGFKPLMKHSCGAYLLAGDLWFCLDLDLSTRKGALQEYTHFAFTVRQADFSILSEKLRSSNAQIWKDNTSEGDSIYFLDPDGHKLEIHVGNWQSRILSAKKNQKYNSLEFFDC